MQDCSKASNDTEDVQWTVKNVQKAGWDNKSRRNTQESTGKEVQIRVPVSVSHVAIGESNKELAK